ncbi:hypothetical protein [Nannocystis pusilla]|uniref:hypothetical protein n=1 Tax=Nannocystis pusilla TaxID=889268 RepID=UPI003DA4466F
MDAAIGHATGECCGGVATVCAGDSGATDGEARPRRLAGSSTGIGAWRLLAGSSTGIGAWRLLAGSSTGIGA